MSLTSIVLLLIVAYKLTSSSLSPLNQHNYFSKNVECIDQLVDELIPISEPKFAFLINMELNENIPVIKYDLYKPMKWNRNIRVPLYIIRVADDNLEDILKWLESNVCLYPKATFIIVTKDVDENVFKTLSKYYIVSVLVVTDDEEIFTYNPYIYENVNSPHLEFSGNSCDDAKNVVEKLLHTVKYPKKWRNSTINTLYYAVAPYIFPCSKCKNFMGMSGIEIDVYKIIKEHVGFNVNFTEHVGDEWGLKINNTYRGGLGLLQQRKVHAMIGACNTHREEHLDFDITTTYYLDTCNWLVPRLETPISWVRYVKIFHYHLWLLIFCTLLAMILYLFTKIGDFNRSFSTVYQIFLESGVNNFHKKLKNVRFVLILFMLCSLVISTIFKNQLFVVLSSQKLRNSIESFDDLLESNIRILLTNRMVKVMEMSTIPKEKKLFRRLYPTPQLTHNELLNEVAFKRNSAMVSIRGLILYILTKGYIDKEGHPLLIILDKPSYSMNIQMFFVKGYPIMEEIDKYFGYAVDNGLMAKERRDKEYDLTRDIYRRRVYVFGAQKLTLLKFKWYWYMLAGGQLLSILTFLAELCVYKILKKLQRRNNLHH